ncbi:MAG TPA: DUF2442 domain-containing protein [Pyrinomonadaceae bacterium]|jgi:hypothetical protein|nr:DUF2442 domain-containing protein [Pyrinomonadaceae bacterium]
MNRVIGVAANDDFSLVLKFNDGSVKRFDAKPYLDYVFFRELKDLNYFKQVSVAFGTVQWPHEQDISPETLYLESVAVPVSAPDDHRNVA